MPSYRVTLRTSSGDRHFSLAAGGTLLRAALRAGLPVARSCRGVAVCAACKMKVLDGTANLAPPGPCQARVHGPCTVTTTYW